jgi:hypothetical protein
LANFVFTSVFDTLGHRVVWNATPTVGLVEAARFAVRERAELLYRCSRSAVNQLASRHSDFVLTTACSLRANMLNVALPRQTMLVALCLGMRDGLSSSYACFAHVRPKQSAIVVLELLFQSCRVLVVSAVFSTSCAEWFGTPRRPLVVEAANRSLTRHADRRLFRTSIGESLMASAKAIPFIVNTFLPLLFARASQTTDS